MKLTDNARAAAEMTYLAGDCMKTLIRVNEDELSLKNNNTGAGRETRPTHIIKDNDSFAARTDQLLTSSRSTAPSFRLERPDRQIWAGHRVRYPRCDGSIATQVLLLARVEPTGISGTIYLSHLRR